MSNIISSNTRPFLLAKSISNISNVTGDGTLYQCVFANQLQINSSTTTYNTSTGVVTVLVQGLYVFGFQIDSGNLSASFTDGVISLVTTGATFSAGECNVGAVRGPANNTMITGTIINVPMNSNDTAYVTVTISGGTKVVSFGNGVNSTFSCARVF